MPELPEVETVRLGLNQVTLNQIMLGGDVLLERTIAHPLSVSAFLQGVQGTAIAQWHRRGKYLLAELVYLDRQSPPESPSTSQPQSSSLANPQANAQANLQATLHPAGYLGVHLRMTGQLLWVDQAEPLPKHCRVRFFFPQQRELRFVDQRTFGQLWWVPPPQPPSAIIQTLSTLGPEPLLPEFSVRYLTDRLRQRQRPIKNALLDQRLVAGIGNIYADESLFLSHIHPLTPSAALKPRQIKQLHGAIVSVLEQAIANRGTTFSDFRDIQGTNGNYGAVAWVYDRDGQPCRVCGHTIERIKLAGRSAHFCPHCQTR